MSQSTSRHSDNSDSESEDEAPSPKLPADPVAAALMQLNFTLTKFSENMKVQALSATLRDMPQFSGKPEEDFEDHLEQYNRYCQRLKLGKKDKILNFSSSLSGKAAEQFMMVPEKGRQKWSTMIACAKRFMVPPLTDMHALAKVLQIRQGDRESVSDYVLRLNRYARIAWQNEGIEDKTLNRLKLTAFLVGLRSDLKRRVPANQKDFMKAVEKALAAEGTYPGEASPAFLEPCALKSECPSVLSDAVANLVTVTCSLSDRLTQQENFQKSGPYSMPQTVSQHKSNPEMVCFNCSMPGHNRGTCFAPGGGANVDCSQAPVFQNQNQNFNNQNVCQTQNFPNQNYNQNFLNQNFQNQSVNQSQNFRNPNLNDNNSQQNCQNRPVQKGHVSGGNNSPYQDANGTPLGNGFDNNNQGSVGPIHERVHSICDTVTRKSVYVPSFMRGPNGARFASANCMGEGYNDPPASNTVWVQKEIGGEEYMCQDPNCHTCTLRRKNTPLKKATNARERRQIMRANQAVYRCSSSCDKSRSYLAESEKRIAPPPEWIFKYLLGIRYPWRPNSQISSGPPRYILDPRKLRKAGWLMDNACCVNEPPKPGVVEVPCSLGQKVAAMNLVGQEKFWEQGEISGNDTPKFISGFNEPQTGSEIDSENLESISQVLEKRRMSDVKNKTFAPSRKSRKYTSFQVSSSSNESVFQQKSEIRIQPVLPSQKKYSNVFMLFVGMILANLFFHAMAFSTNTFADKVAENGSIVLPLWGTVMSPIGLPISTPRTEFVPLIVQLALLPTPPDWVPIGLSKICYDPLHYNSESCKHPIETQEAEYEHVPCPNLHYFETEIRPVTGKYRELYSGLLATRFHLKILYNICRNLPDMRGTIEKSDEPGVETNLARPPSKAGFSRRSILRNFGIRISKILEVGGLANNSVNSVHLGQMDPKVDVIHWAFSRLDQKIVQAGKVLTHLSLAKEKGHTFLHHSVLEMVEMVNDARCANMRYTLHAYQRLLVHISESTLQRSLDSVMHAGLHSVITPELLHLLLLCEIIANNPSLNDALLGIEPNLVYQFGKAYFIRLNLRELKFYFNLEIPVPVTSDITPMFQIPNFGYNFPRQNATLRLPFPKYVQKTKADRYLQVNTDSCETAPGLRLEIRIKTHLETGLRLDCNRPITYHSTALFRSFCKVSVMQSYVISPLFHTMINAMLETLNIVMTEGLFQHLGKPRVVIEILGDGNDFYRCIAYCITGYELTHVKPRNQLDLFATSHQIEAKFSRYNLQNPKTKGKRATEVDIFIAADYLSTDIFIYMLTEGLKSRKGKTHTNANWAWPKLAAELTRTKRTPVEGKPPYLSHQPLTYYIFSILFGVNKPRGALARVTAADVPKP